MDTKQCGRCKINLPLESFYKSKKGLQGRRSNCKSCCSAIQSAIYDATEKRERRKIKDEKIEASTKLCRVCGIEKNKLEFYKSTQNVDGFRTICKPCSCLDGKPRYRKNKVKIKEQVKKWKKENQSRHRSYQNHYGREYNLKYPEKRKSQGRSYYARKIGRLTPVPCEICGATPVQGHHPSYETRHAEWIQWLCLPCHYIANRLSGKYKLLCKKDVDNYREKS